MKTNTQAKHTPGPWEAKFRPFAPSYEIGKRAENGSLDLIANLKDSVPQLEEREANARLIAAAPELLEALKALLEWSEMHDDEQPFVGLHKLITDKGSIVRNAISKAEGKTNE